MNWQPTASIETINKRAKFNAQIRHFFVNKGVLEVETPALSQGTVTDVHLEAFQTNYHHHSAEKGDLRLFLQTSPEFAMKRLLAAGSGAIYQICKAFRDESAGRFHNPEFTMLEWYRPDSDDHQLMAELDELIQLLLGCTPAIKLSYQQAFQQYLDIDPLIITTDEIKAFVLSMSDDDWLKESTDKDTFLQWLFSMKIEPQLGSGQASENSEASPCFVYDFPASQASLARINSRDKRVAHRFELYFKGVELANGFYELQNALEQLTRFEHDNQQRKATGLVEKPIDQYFISALKSGLPNCAGVAVGLDRLFMLQNNLSHIEQTMCFPINNA